MKYVGLLERVNAYIIDALLLLGVSVIVFCGVFVFHTAAIDITAENPIFGIVIDTLIISFVIASVYFTYMTGKHGDTVGKRYFGIKVVTSDGKKPGYVKSLVRAIGYYISSASLYLGFIWIAIDKKKQGWHDKIAKTYVVKR